MNADDPEGALAAVRLAMAYRAEFRRDVVVDVVGYRRFGHNEGDEPAYTQPLMYERIEKHPTVRELYAKDLIDHGVVSEGDVAAMLADGRRLRSRPRTRRCGRRSPRARWAGGRSASPAAPGATCPRPRSRATGSRR